MRDLQYLVEVYCYRSSRNYGDDERYEWQHEQVYPTLRRAENARRRQITDYGRAPEHVRITEVRP